MPEHHLKPAIFCAALVAVTLCSSCVHDNKAQAQLQSVLAHPNLVGAHWFQYTDSETTGRAMDGENYNVGFVSVTDTPYEALVNSAKKINRDLYPLAFGKAIETMPSQ